MAAALEKVRPYVQSHGGDLALRTLTAGTLSLGLSGSCGSCPGMRQSLTLMIETMILDSAPDLVAIKIETIQSAAAPTAAGAAAHARSA